MTAAGRDLQRQPASATPPPCAVEPERWFDRAHRTHALVSCLQCPVRPRCAQQALRSRATWGMWAGIWIDGRLAEVAHLLRAIAAVDPVPSPAVAEIVSATTTSDPQPGPLPRIQTARPARSGSVRATVLARSAGHCEVVTDSCRFTADRQVSRTPGCAVDQATSAAAVYATCRPCTHVFAAADGVAQARHLGFIVDSPARVEGVPLYWRSARWVFLGGSGELHEATDRSACAS